VTKRIETQAQPMALAAGDGSIWAFCKKEGKLDRIDPKTDKPTKTIDLGVPGVDGDVTFGEGSVWVSQVGFPVTRIDPKSEKVVQQFWGAGGGILRASGGSLWLFDVERNVASKLDPKRIQATLAE
jgi:streptogramin lyase